VDLDRGKLAIERSIRRGLQEKRTKSEQDRRVSIDPYTVGLLRAHRAACEGQCNALGVALPRNAFVFSLEPDYSQPMKPDTVTQKYPRLARRNHLRSTRFHALRHYSATELLTSGVDLRTVSGRLGHASGATTLRFYAAWLEEADRSAAGTISKTMPRPVPLNRAPRNPYEQIATDLREAIEDGTYPVGALPPANEVIRSKYKVATGTVSRAIGLLKEAGLVHVVRGKRPKAIATRSIEPGSDVGPKVARDSEGPGSDMKGVELAEQVYARWSQQILLFTARFDPVALPGKSPEERLALVKQLERSVFGRTNRMDVALHLIMDVLER
jgi:integrase